MKKTNILNKKKSLVKVRRIKVNSRHPSHKPLSRNLLNNEKLVQLLTEKKKRVRIRLGSTNEYTSKFPEISINTINAIKTSSNKLLMKQAFEKAGVKTADWWVYKEHDPIGLTFVSGKNGVPTQNNNDLLYPIVAKHIYGSRGTGNFLLKSQEELEKWMNGKNLKNYIFEKFYNYNREYRLHVDEDGCFYTCRKVLKNDTPEDKRWFRNDSNSSWILESNQLFDKPTNWKDIVSESVKALKAVGLDFSGIDVRVQSANVSTKKGEKKREAPDFIIIETNSAPSFGDITLQMYTNRITKKILDRIEK